MAFSPPESAHLGPVPLDEIPQALQLVFSSLTPEQVEDYIETFATNVRTGTTSHEGCITATRGGRLVGAVLSYTQPGRSAVLWPPQIIDGESRETAQRLLSAVCDWLTTQKVRMVSALMQTPTHAEDVVLRDGGFKPLTELLYLVSLEGDFPSNAPESALEFELFRPDQEPRLMSVVSATYEGSLDCPALEGTRAMDEVLESYRATGVFAPDRWLLVRHEGHDVGCLLLADHPEDENWELIYMGLIVPARGRGWGREIVRYAQWRTGQAHRPRLVVAVDAANRPAVDMYASAGFRAWDRRAVYVKRFPDG